MIKIAIALNQEVGAKGHKEPGKPFLLTGKSGKGKNPDHEGSQNSLTVSFLQMLKEIYAATETTGNDLTASSAGNGSKAGRQKTLDMSTVSKDQMLFQGTELLLKPKKGKASPVTNQNLGATLSLFLSAPVQNDEKLKKSLGQFQLAGMTGAEKSEGIYAAQKGKGLIVGEPASFMLRPAFMSGHGKVVEEQMRQVENGVVFNLNVEMSEEDMNGILENDEQSLMNPLTEDVSDIVKKLIGKALLGNGLGADEVADILSDMSVRQLSNLDNGGAAEISTENKLLSSDKENIAKGAALEAIVVPENEKGGGNERPFTENISRLHMEEAFTAGKVKAETLRKEKFGFNLSSDGGDHLSLPGDHEASGVFFANKQEAKAVSHTVGLNEAPQVKNTRELLGRSISADLSFAKDDLKKTIGISPDKGENAFKEKSLTFDQGDLSVTSVINFATRGQELPSLQTAPLIDQITDQLPQSANKGSGRIKITLTPPNLGSLDMDVLVRENKVQVIMTAENPDVQRTLQGNSDQLKNALQQQGLQVDSLDVFLQGGQTGQRGEAGGGNPFWRDINSGEGDAGRGEPETVISTLTHVLEVKDSAAGGISLFV